MGTPCPTIVMGGGTVKIFKKCAPNGRVYVYMGKREFVSIDGCPEPINGVVHIQDYKDTIKGRRVIVQLVITFRHGREDDETMGLSFKKELILDRTQIYPPENRGQDETKLQTRPIHSSTHHYISEISPSSVCRPNIALCWIAYIFLASSFPSV